MREMLKLVYVEKNGAFTGSSITPSVVAAIFEKQPLFEVAGRLREGEIVPWRFGFVTFGRNLYVVQTTEGERRIWLVNLERLIREHFEWDIEDEVETSQEEGVR